MSILVRPDQDQVMAAASLMIKPVGAACNLDCAYCYYLDVEGRVYDGNAKKMSLETLEATLRDYLAAAPDRATICWQGGEPTLAGLPFFEKAIVFVNAYKRPGPAGRPRLCQTNGTLLDDNWCRFFKREAILIGISIDGGPPLHDLYRYDKQNRKTHAQVMRGSESCCGGTASSTASLCAAPPENVKHPRHLFEHLVGLGEKWLQFIRGGVENDAQTGRPVPSTTPHAPQLTTADSCARNLRPMVRRIPRQGLRPRLRHRPATAGHRAHPLCASTASPAIGSLLSNRPAISLAATTSSISGGGSGT
ncbi:MAG: radical SAM protein [Phycisphaerales bacterium]